MRSRLARFLDVPRDVQRQCAKTTTILDQGHTTDHSPAREHWHQSKADVSARRSWFVDGQPPRLTPRQAELYGLVPYGQTATPT